MAASSSGTSALEMRFGNMSNEMAASFWDMLSQDAEDEALAAEGRLDPTEQGEWVLVQGRRKTAAAPVSIADPGNQLLAQKLNLNRSVGSLSSHQELMQRILQQCFNTPGSYGLDVTRKGKNMSYQWKDLTARQGNMPPKHYPLASVDEQDPAYWAGAGVMASTVDYVQLFTWIKQQVALWTAEFHTVYVFVDDRCLHDQAHCPDFWPLFAPWIKARCSYVGPCGEATTALHVPIGRATGLDRVHFTWAGTFVLEALVYLFPDKHFILTDTDCVPTSLFEVEELARLFSPEGGKPDDAYNGNAVLPRGNGPLCSSMVMLCSEFQAEINAGMVIVTSCRSRRPHLQNADAQTMATGLMASRRRYVQTQQDPPDYSSLASSGLLWAPLLLAKAELPVHWTHAWALLGEWSGHVCFPLPDRAADGKYNWVKHGTAMLLDDAYKQRVPPLVSWGRPAFEQGALPSLVFLPADFPVLVLPGDKLFQNRHINSDVLLAPVTHAYGTSKLKIGRSLQGHATHAPLPLMPTLCGHDGKLPLWASTGGVDFIRGARMVNQKLSADLLALPGTTTHLLWSCWRPVVPQCIGHTVWTPAAYDVPIQQIDDSIAGLDDHARETLLTAYGNQYGDSVTPRNVPFFVANFSDVWKDWNEVQRAVFQLRWVHLITGKDVPVDGMTDNTRELPLILECSGLGGAHILHDSEADLFLQCTNQARVYGGSLAAQDHLADTEEAFHSTTMGRTAHIHEYHMLHAAAWPIGVIVWERILGQFHEEELPEATPGIITTRASLMATVGDKWPAHMRPPHPGFVTALRLFLMCVQPLPLLQYFTRVLFPASQRLQGAEAPAFPDVINNVRQFHVIGHSAGSFNGLVVESILCEADFGSLLGLTAVTAIAVPPQLLELDLNPRRVTRLVHVQDDALCVWRPSENDLFTLAMKGYQVTYIGGTAHWMGTKVHNYAHLTHADLGHGKFTIQELERTVEGILPPEEIRKAPLRLMSWCAFRMPEDLQDLLTALSELCGKTTTTMDDLVRTAQQFGVAVPAPAELQAYLVNQLLCSVNKNVLPHYQGVVGEYLNEVPLPMAIYLMDYFLPQLSPHEGAAECRLTTFAAPIHYEPYDMEFHFKRKDGELAHYWLKNYGYAPMVMTSATADKCNTSKDYVVRHQGRPLEYGRLVGIIFTERGQSQKHVVFGIVMEIVYRDKAKWLTKAPQNAHEIRQQSIGNTVHKCNPKHYELALLLGGSLDRFARRPLNNLQYRLGNLQVVDLAVQDLPQYVTVVDVYAFGTTRPAKELYAVSNTPWNRLPRGLGLLCDNHPATSMPMDRRVYLQSLLSQYLERLTTPWHISLPGKHDNWFRARVLPFAIDEDAHFLAVVTALQMALVTGRLDLSIQGLFGAGKSRAAALLIVGLMALDTEHRLNFMVICKENTGTKSFMRMIRYIGVPDELHQRIGRLVANEVEQDSMGSTPYDIPHKNRAKLVKSCSLLAMTGGTYAADRCGWSHLAGWQENLVLAVIDEAQQFGTDREVVTIAFLPRECFVIWTGDAKQTPGGVAKDDDAALRARKKLMVKPHGLRCPQMEVTPHSLHRVLVNLLQDRGGHVPEIAELFRLGRYAHGPIWNDDPVPENAECLALLSRLSERRRTSWGKPGINDLTVMPHVDTGSLTGCELNCTTISLLAVLCSSFDCQPDWLSALLAHDTRSNAGVEGPHAWGLMLPTSTRVAGVTYHSIVGVGYPAICEVVDGIYRLGTHSSGGVEGFVGGFQLE